ncbi:hypothetical protein TDB9533_04804 [Thalassocella blandensis]|nr:hypothetical protein TDB9533_04804 [Thalassocella blandensis]
MKARFYDPDVGRFMNQDTYLGEHGTPPSLHRYLYAYSNPTVYVDPDGHKSVFGDATNQLDNFKDYLDAQNERADNGWVAAGVGTAKAVTSLGQVLTGFLDTAANLAQVATGVDDQQVRDELAATRGMVTDVIDYAVNGDYAAGAKKVHAAAVSRTADAFGGDVSAISDVSEGVSMLATLRPGAGPRVARGPTVSQSVQATKQVVQQVAKSKTVTATTATIERAITAGGNRMAQIANSAATAVQESAKTVLNNAMKPGPTGLRRQIGAVGDISKVKLGPKPTRQSRPNVDINRPVESSHYTVAFRAKLKKGQHYPDVNDYKHFQEGHRQLYEAMKADSQLAEMMENLYPGIRKLVEPGKSGKHTGASPAKETGLTWHHNIHEEGILELMSMKHHTSKGVVQDVLHPGKKGGMETWGGGTTRKK